MLGYRGSCHCITRSRCSMTRSQAHKFHAFMLYVWAPFSVITLIGIIIAGRA